MGDRRLNYPLVILCLIFLVGLLISLFIKSYPVSANSESSLRSDITNLRTRIGYLEGEVRRLAQRQNRSNSSSPELSPSSGPEIVEGELIGQSDPLFERLSILVIELKERVIDVEKRMTQIEQKIGI